MMRTQRPVWFRLAVAVLGTVLAATAAAQPPIPGQPAQKKAGPADTAPPPQPATAPPLESILGPNEYPIDLGTALRLAGAENPELLIARQRVTEVQATRMLAVAQLLPNFNTGLNYDQHSGPLQQANGNIVNVNRKTLYLGMGANAVAAGTVNIPGLNYNLNVSESWFGFLTSRQRLQTVRASADAVRNDVMLRVCLAYLDLLRADSRRAIAVKNRGEAAEVARITKAYTEAKAGRKADADRAYVELKKRDVELTQAEADTLTATARLCQLINLDPSTRLKPIDGWVVPTPLVPDPIPLSELLAIALLQRPELAARRSEVLTALYELSSAKILPFSPNVILGYSAGGFGGGSAPAGTSPGFGALNGRDDFDVVVYWTFRNLGVGNVALVRAADSRMKQSRLRELETMNTVRSEVAESHARVAARFLQIDATEKAVQSSKQAYEEDYTRIKNGQGLPLELMDSLRLLGRSRYEYLDTIVDYNRAQFQLYVALGRPPANALARPIPTDLVPPPLVIVQAAPAAPMAGPQILNFPPALPLRVKP